MACIDRPHIPEEQESSELMDALHNDVLTLQGEIALMIHYFPERFNSNAKVIDYLAPKSAPTKVGMAVMETVEFASIVDRGPLRLKASVQAAIEDLQAKEKLPHPDIVEEEGVSSQEFRELGEVVSMAWKTHPAHKN